MDRNERQRAQGHRLHGPQSQGQVELWALVARVGQMSGVEQVLLEHAAKIERDQMRNGEPVAGAYADSPGGRGQRYAAAGSITGTAYAKKQALVALEPQPQVKSQPQSIADGQA